jgi:hypothetical protein
MMPVNSVDVVEDVAVDLVAIVAVDFAVIAAEDFVVIAAEDFVVIVAEDFVAVDFVEEVVLAASIAGEVVLEKVLEEVSSSLAQKGDCLRGKDCPCIVCCRGPLYKMNIRDK